MWGEDKRVVIAPFHVSASARTAVIAIGLLRFNGFRWRDTKSLKRPHSSPISEAQLDRLDALHV
jgi:hypothetical protein